MKLKTLYAIPFLIVFLTACISAYSYQIPVCNSTLNTSCIPITNISSITNAPHAIIYFQDGNLYITNDTFYPNATTVINNTYYYTTQVTNLTYVTYNYTYIMNYSNGSSFIFQPNITLDEDAVVSRINKLYSLSNFSRFYNKTEIDGIFVTQSQMNNLVTSLGTYATKGDLVNFDTRLASLNNLNSINWSSFNLTKINEHIDNGGDFSTTWKTIVIIEGIIILLLLIFVAKAAMSGGGEF